MSKFQRIVLTQKIPVGIDTAWEFFSSPQNLSKITPPKMGFNITSDFAENDKMYEGKIITYKVSPFLNLKLDWMTEITHITEKQFFVDEQRFGPYAMWHHEHHFKAIDGGVEMKDIVNYVVPFAFLGQIANYIFVKKQLQTIFDYRQASVEHIFGKFENQKI